MFFFYIPIHKGTQRTGCTCIQRHYRRK